MMFVYGFVGFIVCIIVEFAVCDENVVRYLKNRTDFVSSSLRGAQKTSGDGVRMEFYDLQPLHLQETYKNVFVFSLFNVNHLLMDTNVYVIDENNEIMPLQIFDGENADTFAFVKAVTYNNLGIVVFAHTSGLLSIYGKNKNQTSLSFFHSIATKLCSDVNFFQHNSELYLIVTVSGVDLEAGTQSACRGTCVFKWTGVHFDRIHEVQTVKAVAVDSFAANDDIIVVVLQKNPPSLVFTFRNNSLHKIQNLKTTHPLQVIAYKIENNHHIVILDGPFYNTYLWNGAEFTLIKSLPCPKLTKIYPYLTNNDPTFFAIKTSKLTVFKPTLTGAISQNITIDLHKNYTNVSKIVPITLNDDYALLVFDENATTTVLLIPFALHFNATTSDDQQDEDDLLVCLKSLTNAIEGETKKKAEKLKSATRATFSNKHDDVVGAGFSEKNEQKMDVLRNYLDEMETQAAKIQLELQEFIDRPIMNDAAIRGDLIAQTLQTNSIQNVIEINNKTWKPDTWLFYNERQNVTAPVFAKTVVVKNLRTSPGDPLFQNLLLRDSTQTLTGNIAIQSLNAAEINCGVINGIPFDAIYFRGQGAKIKGVKIFDSLKARNVEVDKLNRKASYETLNTLSNVNMYDFKFGSHLNVENLFFEEINGTNWNEFKGSVFRRGKTSTIYGNLLIHKLDVENLKVEALDGVVVDNFFTKTTDQVVDSVIHFRNVDIAKNLNCRVINNVDMLDTIVAKPGEVVVIKDPVSIKQLKVYDKLYIDTSKRGFASNATETIHKNSTLQIYHKKVKIVGNVEVNSAFFDAHAKVTVNGQPFQNSIIRNYWWKNHFQVIPVHVTFAKNVSVQHLLTGALNGIDINDYMMQNRANVKSGDYHFENITVFGDVFLNENKKHWPDFKAIDSGSVKYSGSYTIKGKKSFDGTVIVQHLNTTTLENIDVSKAVHKNSNARITGRKRFENLRIAKDLEAKSSIIKKINDTNLLLLQTEALYVDEETLLSHVHFDDLKVQNLRVNKLNGKSLNDFVVTQNRKRKNNTIVSLSIQGNVTINNATVGVINGVHVNKLVTRMLNDTVVVPYDVHFSGNVRIKNLQAATINDLNIKRFSKGLLYRNYEQIVTAPFAFNNIITDNLYTEKINNISLIHLLETNSQSSFTNTENVTLDNIHYIKTLTAKSFSCDIENAINQLENPTKSKWESVEITGNLKILNVNNSKFLNFLQNIVTTNSKNVITAPVIFKQHIFANIVTTAGQINDVNITHIAHDAIFRTVKGKPITITGKNVFQTLKTAEITVHGNAAIREVNNISIAKLNASIVQKNPRETYVIRGRKTFFHGLQIDKLYAKTVAGLKPENLVNLKNLRVIPIAAFDRLVVKGNMSVTYVNNVIFDWFLNNRVLRKSNTSQTLQGTYHFENMLLNSVVRTPHLNNLLIEDIVTDSDDVQLIESEKTFVQDVFTSGNIKIGLLNNLNLTQYYRDSLMRQHNETIHGNVNINSTTTFSSDLNVQTLNGMPIERLKYILNFHDPEIVATTAGNTLEKISNIVERSLRSLKFLPDQFMYIHEVTTLSTSLPFSQDSRIIQLTPNSTLVLLDGQTSGVFCGLPVNCPCPIEHSIYFGPGKIAINNNTNHRVFKYNEENLFISLSTRASSVSSYCRTNYSRVMNEYSQLSWRNVKTGVNGSTKISGYLSDVEFFTYDGHVYIVYCQYYDSVLDTNELICTVLRNNENSDFEKIQHLPVKGAWKTHILYTAQGIVLIIGNVIPGVSNHTDIYRFSPTIQKFEFLRDVKLIGCTSAAGVVLGTDSLIILAQPETPVHILKYDSIFDNYYYYQSFEMDSPVVGVSVFYTGDFGISDAYLVAITANGDFNVYSFNQIEGWKLESNGGFQGLTDLIPIEMNRMSYLFAPSTERTRLLAIVKQSYV